MRALGVASCADLKLLTESDLKREVPAMKLAECRRLLAAISAAGPPPAAANGNAPAAGEPQDVGGDSFPYIPPLSFAGDFLPRTPDEAVAVLRAADGGDLADIQRAGEMLYYMFEEQPPVRDACDFGSLAAADGGLEALVAALHANSDCVYLASGACRALEAVPHTEGVANAVERAIAAGAVEAIVAALNKKADSAAVARVACLALGNLCAYAYLDDLRAAESQRRAVAAGGVEAVVAALKRHGGATPNVDAACWALERLCDDLDSAKRAGAAGGVEAAAAALEAHGGNVHLSAQICGALRSMCRFDENKERAAAAGVPHECFN